MSSSSSSSSPSHTPTTNLINDGTFSNKEPYLQKLIMPLTRHILSFLSFDELTILVSNNDAALELLVVQALNIPMGFLTPALCGIDIRGISYNKITRKMCHGCKNTLIDLPGLLCNACAKHAPSCHDCLRERVPLDRVANCINSNNDKKFRGSYKYYDDPNIIPTRGEGSECCYKYVCRYGCTFICQGTIKTDNGYKICSKKTYRPLKLCKEDVPYNYTIDDYHRLECDDCAKSTAMSLGKGLYDVFERASFNDRFHCEKCRRHDCQDQDCDGKCYLCKSLTSVLVTVPSCTKSRHLLESDKWEDYCCSRKVCMMGCRCQICDCRIDTAINLLNDCRLYERSHRANMLCGDCGWKKRHVGCRYRTPDGFFEECKVEENKEQEKDIIISSL